MQYPVQVTWCYDPEGGAETTMIRESEDEKKIQAICQALSMKNADKAVIVMDAELKFDGKTKSCVKVLKDLKAADKNTLMVVSEKTPEILRSTNNIANLKLVRATYLNVFDIMNADAVGICMQLRLLQIVEVASIKIRPL